MSFYPLGVANSELVALASESGRLVAWRDKVYCVSLGAGPYGVQGLYVSRCKNVSDRLLNVLKSRQERIVP